MKAIFLFLLVVLTSVAAPAPVAVFRAPPPAAAAGGGTLPLDVVTGAAGAYSTRLVRAAYSGSLIRVRRSSDNAEQDIGVTSVTNLDTASLLTFTGAGSGFVVTYYDQTANGNNFGMATAGTQPQIVISGQLITNAAGLALPYWSTLMWVTNPGSMSVTTNFTIISKYTSQEVSPATRMLFAKDGVSGGASAFAVFMTANTYDWFFSNISASPVPAPTFTTTNTILNSVLMVSNNAMASIFTNGIFHTNKTITAATTANTKVFWMGRESGGFPWFGKIWDFYIYTNVLSQQNITDLNTY